MTDDPMMRELDVMIVSALFVLAAVLYYLHSRGMF